MRRRKPARSDPSEDLRLFDPPERIPLVGSGRGHAGLVVDDELLWSRVVHLHSADKAYYVRRFAEIVATAMRGKFKGGVWWIELFCGPGRLFEKETGRFLPGSPLDALGIPRPFDGYVFADVNQACVESLRRRVEGSNVYILQGDANSADVHDRVAAIVPRNALVVLYADPEGLDLFWPTVKYFVDRYPRIDLLLNLPVSGAVRALAAGFSSKAGRVLDHTAPHELLLGANRGASVRDWYWRKLEAERFRYIDSVPINLRGTNRALYDLVVASRHERAVEFFQESLGVGPAGQYALPVG